MFTTSSGTRAASIHMVATAHHMLRASDTIQVEGYWNTTTGQIVNGAQSTSGVTLSNVYYR